MEFHPILFATIHLILFLFPSISSAQHDNFTDLSSLLAFKANVDDPFKVLSSSWTTNTSFCTWTGVKCSRKRQRVVALQLDNLSLYGKITPHIANLSFLSYLNLTNNSFTGQIPESLAYMPRLKLLMLGQNQLSGSIPLSIFNMSSLILLSLFENDLSGTLPSNSSSIQTMLPQIQALSVSFNQLTGSIPSGFSYCYHLRTLSLSYNQFSGNIPMELGNLQQLQFLYLGPNNLTGTIPVSFGNLTSLVSLSVAQNDLYGTIPEELGDLSNLQQLYLGRNQGLTGSIPISLSNMSSLQSIDFASSSLTGPLLVNFGNMPQLVTLYLGWNKLSGGLDFLGSLSNCRYLENVGLWKNEFEGFLPSTIGNLSRSLSYFVADGNLIKGKVPAEFGNISSLTSLGLGTNELDGPIPSEIAMLENLQLLSLENNRLSGSIPFELGNLKMLNTLYIRRNKLSGAIPDSLGNLSSLEHLELGENALSSEIPQSIWSLTRLIELDLSQNVFQGSLSSAISKMKALDSLSISMNQLSGTIPNAIKELQMLSALDLSYNSFTGQIPQVLGDLTNIAYLNLSCNNFSGVIPDSLSNLRHLSSLNLSFNKLEGVIPNKGAFLNHTVISLVGNEALCGSPKLGFPLCSTNVSVSHSKSRLHSLKYILPAIAFALIIVLGLYIRLKSHKGRSKNSNTTGTQFPNNYRLISYHELVRATENFSEANLLGRGAFGSVYKGQLDDGLLTAVKVLNLEVDGASKSFDAECNALRMVRHRNLVKIITTCSNLDFRALVLQFMPNGSLERWLYSHTYCLSLLQRINIVIDVASAIEYLHHHHSQAVLHRDLKPSNILLDEEMTAHVSDFGIAKLLGGDNQSVTSANAPGTIGYIAPEYASNGRVSTKGDVYSFGILLLEIFIRKKPIDPIFFGKASLRQHACDAYHNALLEIVDQNLLKDESGNARARDDVTYIHSCLSSLIELGIICSSDSPKERLMMKEVVPNLQKIRVDYLAKFPNA